MELPMQFMHLITFKEEKLEVKGQKIAVDFLRDYYKNLNIQAAEGTNNYFQEMTLKLMAKWSLQKM